MAKTRSELREKCMIILYQYEIYKNNNQDIDIEDIIKDNLDIRNDFVDLIVKGVVDNYDEINDIANKYMIDWNIDRIDKTGSCILRMAIYELKYTDTPEVVVINEAIELAKKYSDDNVKNIINAVLDKIIKD